MTKRKAVPREPKPDREGESGGLAVIDGKRVKALYEAKGWSQQELAWRANVSIQKISRIVLEQRGCGTAILLRLVTALGTNADYLLRLSDNPRPRSD